MGPSKEEQSDGSDRRMQVGPGWVGPVGGVRRLYRYEIKALRTALLAGRIPKADYASHVIALRKRYWLLSVPLQLWTRRDSGSAGPADIR